MDYRSNVKAKTRKVLKENVEKFLHDLGVSDNFLDWGYKVVAIVEKESSKAV